jgi:hypothetical protein
VERRRAISASVSALPCTASQGSPSRGAGGMTERGSGNVASVARLTARGYEEV